MDLGPISEKQLSLKKKKKALRKPSEASTHRTLAFIRFKQNHTEKMPLIRRNVFTELGKGFFCCLYSV